eukprot:CAMPEP_0185849986 /NCGR_PEP_ID=MMETSP1354-20130828/4288_1 /TAXON_ID=708628 /ORGANISM="Erythrolobus madagascarensis, Strain CCMP3276" /LENGTH=51 /DNA_ID=CAMNT_0028550603 /DNA_START=597 /DNA_END=752 /DNA_ORIENTATION=+
MPVPFASISDSEPTEDKLFKLARDFTRAVDIDLMRCPPAALANGGDVGRRL